MKRFGVCGLLVLGLLLVPVAASDASPTTCNGTVSGTYQALVVPSGATCTLNGATVQGDVKVLAGGTLDSTAATSTIQGNLVNRGGRVVNVCGNINGNVSSIGGSGFALDADVCSQSFITVGGSISVSGVNTQSNDVFLRAIRASGSVSVTNNTAYFVYVISSTIGGDLTVTGNSPFILNVDSNQVDGNVTVSRNQGGTQYVQTNRVSGDLNCFNNNPPPSVHGNTVSGSANGQCKV